MNKYLQAEFSSSLIAVRMRERSCVSCCHRQQRPMSFGTDIFIVYSALLSFSFVCKFFFPSDCVLLFSRMIATFRKMRICSRCRWLAKSPLCPLTPWWIRVARGSTSTVSWICEGTDGLNERANLQWLTSAKGDLLPKLPLYLLEKRDFSRGWFRTGP